MEPVTRSPGTYNPATRGMDLTDTPHPCDDHARAKAVDLFRETWGVAFGRDVSQLAPTFGAFWSQSWHFAGGIPTADGSTRVAGTANVFSGDTGALQTPFSCHTSMPSAAAGVVAAMEAIGSKTSKCNKYMTFDTGSGAGPGGKAGTAGKNGKRGMGYGRLSAARKFDKSLFNVSVAGIIAGVAAAIGAALRRRSKGHPEAEPLLVGSPGAAERLEH